MRVLFSTDVPVVATRAVRGAIAFPAAASDTPPGGVSSAALRATTAGRLGGGRTGGISRGWSAGLDARLIARRFAV